MRRFRPPRFHLRTLLVATAAIAVLLLAVVLTPQLVARDARLEVLRQHVDQMVRLAASQVDGDLHRQLLDGAADQATLARARTPLLRLHATWPEVHYLYTMGMEDGRAYFILDTAQDVAFAARHGLTASAYMEPFEQREEYRDNWLTRLALGEVYVTPGFQRDDYGTFLSGHAPFHDSTGAISGFIGADFSLDHYLSEDRRFRHIEYASIAVTLLLSLVLGYLYAWRQYAQQAELRHHFRSSMLDPLTGLHNRRGALAAVAKLWEAPDANTHAVLLVDIDNFKHINDSRGHHAGDAVLRALASALRRSVRPGDITARLGGDEFLVFARGCDQQAAELIANRLLTEARSNEGAARFTVSVGFAISDGMQGGFDLLYRHADAALYQAKGEGRDRYAMFTASRAPREVAV
jgi:diguanylate cyclase (GGDEF)-like protein